MPAKNVVREFAQHQYYHVYNRGVAKQRIFLDQNDKQYLMSLLDRYLNPSNTNCDYEGVPYRKFDKELELLSFCLMNNHFHLLVYQADNPTALSELMKSIGTSYTMYFNLKYKRVGPLFQGPYKARRITNDSYLTHISRYIHLNPREYLTYKYSSLPSYLGRDNVAWIRPSKILDMFEGTNYLEFLQDYEDTKLMLDEIKHELANS